MYVTSWSLSLLLCEVWTVTLIVKSVMKLRPCSARSIHVVDGMVCPGLLLSAQLLPLGLSDACLPDRSHWSIASAQCLPSASLFLLIFPSFTLNSTSATHWVYEGCQPSALSVSSFSLKFIHIYSPILSSVQFSSVTQLCPTLCDPMDCRTARQASLSITNSRSSPKLMCIESVMPSSHLILCCPLLLLPPIPPSIRVFSNESTLRMRWPKHWSFSFSISPSNEYSGLISFRIDWFDFLADQGTPKSLLQHHSSKASIFSAQPSLWSNSHISIRLLEKLPRSKWSLSFRVQSSQCC